MPGPHLSLHLATAIDERLQDLGFEALPTVTLPGEEAFDLLVVPAGAGHPRLAVMFVAGRLDGATAVIALRHRVDELLAGISGTIGIEQVIIGLPAITPALSTPLSNVGLGYVDAAGNADFAAPGIRVLVAGQELDPQLRDVRTRERAAGWATRPTGLRVVFALLTRTGLLGARQADIAETAGVSISTVHHVLHDLDERGLLDATRRDRVWLDEAGARRLWIDTYTAVIAPTVAQVGLVDTEHLPPSQWADLLSSTNTPGWVTGAAALDRLGDDLVADTATLYVPDTRLFARHYQDQWNRRARLMPAARGEEPNVFLRQAWWPAWTYPYGLAPALLFIADGLTSGDSRVAGIARQMGLG